MKDQYIMKNLILTLFSVLTIVILVQAQDGYVKFKSDFEYRDKTVKCYKNEIFPFYKSKKDNNINVIIGSDTITHLLPSSKNFIKIDNPNTSYLANTNDLVKLKDNDNIFIECKYLSLKDTLTLISEQGKQIIHQILKKDSSINRIECGKSFRIILTNAPTIFYSIDRLQKYIPPITDRDGDGIADKNDSCPDTPGVAANNGCPNVEKSAILPSLSWYYYLLIIVTCIVLSGVGVWWFLKARRLKPNQVRFSGDSLKFFVENHGGFEKLNLLNKEKIPTKTDWNRLNDKEKVAFINSLRGKAITIPVKEEREFSISDQPSAGNESLQGLSNKKHEDEQGRPYEVQGETINRLSTELKQVENTILNAIQKLNSKGNDKSNEVIKLNKDVAEIKNEKLLLESEKRKLEEIISQIKKDKTNLDQSFQLIISEKTQLSNELVKLKEKVISVDNLSSYCESVLSYFKVCNKVIVDAYDAYNRITTLNIHQAYIPGYLLLKFQDGVKDVPFGNWIQICQDIKDTSSTTNEKLIRSFSQITSDEERKREIQRLLFADVLVKYSSNILILAEAFRNLSRFQVSLEIIKDIQSTFTKHVSDLLSKVKATGLENKYVPLFQNFEEFLGQIESVDKEKSLAYNNIIGLEKGTIIEVVSYGVKTSFEDNKTLIILE
jgi:hypothetical protein